MESVEQAKRVWSTGSYADTATQFLPMAGQLVDRAAVSPEDHVLDIGCGTGIVAITAARRGADVTGLDLTPSMLDLARENAEVAGVDEITWREGNATALPFDADRFDVVLSNLGHMYADPPQTAADELIRVARPGGRIGFTATTPTALYAAMSGVMMTYLTPDALPKFSEPPFMWGDADVVEARLGDSVDNLDCEVDTLQIPVLSPGHLWEQTVTNSGMFIEFFDAVDGGDRPALREQMIDTIEPFFDEISNTVELEYLRTSATVTTEKD